MTGLAERVLTRRQEKVLIAFAAGLVGRRIAQELGVSLPTVSREMSAVVRKLGAQNDAQAVSIAHEIGLLPALAEFIEDVPQSLRANQPSQGVDQ